MPENSEKQVHVLYVEDSEIFRDLYSKVLQQLGWIVESLATYEEALNKIQNNEAKDIDIFVFGHDLNDPEMRTGESLAAIARKKYSGKPVVNISYNSHEWGDENIRKKELLKTTRKKLTKLMDGVRAGKRQIKSTNQNENRPDAA